MPSKSKTKGSTWERDIANHLSEIYNEKFLRVPASGGFIGGANVVRKQSLDESQIRNCKGDIIPPSTWKYFNCEAKNYADFPFHLLISGNCKQLDTWINQLMIVADPHDMNILIFKISRQGKFVAVPADARWSTVDSFFTYKSPVLGSWMIFEYDKFWMNNATTVQQSSVNGITVFA
jgi:hypothetical protein